MDLVIGFYIRTIFAVFNSLNITPKICTCSVFVTAEIQTIFHSQFVRVFVINLHTMLCQL
jgi:hypothetical protein